MNVRETLNKNPALAAGVTVVAIAVAGWFVYASVVGPGKVEAPKKAFYTIDDGKTLFEDAAGKLVPFTKDGQEAVLARVITCDDGKTRTVSYLQKFTDNHVQQVLAGKKPAPGPFTTLVKKPGEGEWVPMVGPLGGPIANPQCPKGAMRQDVFP